MEDASLVKVRSARVMNEDLERGIGTEEGKEGVMVYEKRFGLGSCWRHERRSG